MIQIFDQKVFPSQTWKLANVNFWPKSKIHYSFCRKLFYLKFFARLSLDIFIKGLRKTLKLWIKTWNYEYIEVWKRVEQVMRKHQFLQTILEMIFGKKLKTQAKLDQTSKLWYLFLINFWPLFIRVHIWRGELGLGCVLTKISKFLMILSFKFFGNLRDN